MPAEKQRQDLFESYGDVDSPRIAADAESLTERYGRFSAQPFERGFGTTIGNSLRRALLSSIEGVAITAVKIEGVEHEFASINGVAEDATDLILNLKQVPFKLHTKEVKTLKIAREDPGEVTSADIEADADVEILDPTIHIATINEGGSLRVEMRLKHGRGYVSADRNFDEDLEIGYIAIDSVHTPVKKVNYNVEAARVRESTDFDKLTVEVWTDGSVKPEEAIGLAAKLIQERLSIFITFQEDTDDLAFVRTEGPRKSSFDQMKARLHRMLIKRMDLTKLGLLEPEQLREEVAQLALNLLIQEDTPFSTVAREDLVHEKRTELLDRSVDELGLSVRSYNCLKNADFRTLRDLVHRTEQDLLATKNFGKKSLNEIKEVLNNMGLDFGMDFDEVDDPISDSGDSHVAIDNIHNGADLLSYKKYTPPAALHDLAGEVEQQHDAQVENIQALLGDLEQKANVKLVPAARDVVQESIASKYVIERYRSLVDRKYLNGLSSGETDELDALRATLDQMDKPYYDAIIRGLRDLIQQSRT